MKKHKYTDSKKNYCPEWYILQVAVAIQAIRDIYIYRRDQDCEEYQSAKNFIEKYAEKAYMREAYAIMKKSKKRGWGQK